MKVGAENKNKLYAMLVLMAVAAFFLLRMFWSSDAPPTTVSASIPNTASPAGATAQGRRKAAAPLDPTLRTDLLKNSEAAEYKGSGRNIFEAQATPAPITKEKPPVVAQQQQPITPQQAGPTTGTPNAPPALPSAAAAARATRSARPCRCSTSTSIAPAQSSVPPADGF